MVSGEHEKIANREWQSTPVFLPGESHGQKSPAAYSPLNYKESDMTERATNLFMNISGLQKGKITLFKHTHTHTHTHTNLSVPQPNV